MPLDMRILESRDPDGRLVEAIKHGRKVNSSDFDALATLSKKYLSKNDADLDGAGAQFDYIKGGRKGGNKPMGTVFVKKTRAERPPRPPSTSQTRQQEMDAKTAKRRAKRQKKK